MSAITAKASRKMKKYAVLTREPRCFLGSFDFSWEQRKFDEVFDCTVPNNTLSRAELSYDEGTVLNVHYGDVLIKYGSVLDVQKDDIPRIPHRCREDFNGALLQDGDVIIADTAEDETTGKACEIGNLQGSAIVSGLHTMVCRPRNRMALGYLGYYLNSNAYHHQLLPLMQGIKVLSLSRSNIQKTSVSYPIAVKEQQLIAYYFSQLDNLITLHQRECISFTGRAGRLILTANKKRTTSSWEQRKLGDIADIVGGGTPSTGNQSYWDGDIDWYAPAEIADQIYANSSQKKITGLGYENSSAKMLPPGTVLFTSRAGIGKTAILTRKGCTNQGFQSIVPHRGELDSYFIFSRTEELKRYGELVGAGSTFVEVSGKQMAVMELMMPPTMREQQTIGGFFQQFDHLITLHQRKCALIFSSFQALISMMFTTSTFSWEQRKFDEVFDCTVPNNTLSRAELSYDEGTVLNVHYGDVLIKYGSVLDVQKDDIPRIPHRCREDFNGALLQDGDVIIADTAEDETTGKACEIGNLQGSAIVSGLHTMVCRPRNRMALGYLGYYLNSNAYHHQLLPLMQGIKVLSLSRSNIQKTSVSYPIAVKEQQLIAYYFSQLDNLITLHQRECISFTGRAGRLILTANKKRTTSSWEQRKLGDIADIVGGGTPSTGNQSYWDGDIDWYAPAEIADQIYANSSQKKITGLGYENSSAKMLPPGTVLFTSRAGIGKTAILTRKGCTNQGFQSIVPHRGELDSYFIFSRTEELKRYGELVGAGSTFVEVSGKQMAVMELMMPPTMREQQTIGGFFQQFDHLITLHQRKPFLMKWRTSDANRNQTNRLVL